MVDMVRTILGATASRARPARDRRHNGNSIAFSQGRVFLLQVADVFVVQVHVDEGPQFAVIGKKMAAQVGVLSGEFPERFADVAGGDIHRVLFFSVLAQRSWY